MVTQAYRTWVAKGRRFRRPPWLTELKTLARKHGVAFLGDLGSDDQRHLQNDFPQDHTPFSFTEWPTPIDEYVINAIDLQSGAHGDRLIADARAGKLPWVKYINHKGWQYNVKNAWKPVRNNDQHLHVSGRTDHTWTGLNGYNPFIAAQPTGEDFLMALTQEQQNQVWEAAEIIRWNLRGWTLMHINEDRASAESDAERDKSLAGFLNELWKKVESLEAKIDALSTPIES